MWRQLVKSAEPTLFVTLTQVGRTLKEAARVLTTALQYIRRGSKGRGVNRIGARLAYPIQGFAVLEEHRDFEKVGFHWHLLVKGVDFLPNQVVSDALRSATKGHSYITKVVRVRNNTAVGYGTKYLTKEIMREQRGIEEEERMVPVVALDAVEGALDERGEVFAYMLRRDEKERVVERLCKAHRIRYSRNFFPEPTVDLRRRLLGQEDDEDEINTGVGTESQIKEGEAPDTRGIGEVGNADHGDQFSMQVPYDQHSSESEEFQEISTSGVSSEVRPLHSSVWVLHESDPFSDDIREYKRRRRKALVESLIDLRGGRRLYSRRVVGIWAYQRGRLQQVA